mmetsp:Transcript_32282/g.76100  ORF Transcript_32282/g.76100 Transcript_32282/m.76100 type:complete len:241 (+) Transcript_32282:155-877(+)
MCLAGGFPTFVSLPTRWRQSSRCASTSLTSTTAGARRHGFSTAGSTQLRPSGGGCVSGRGSSSACRKSFSGSPRAGTEQWCRGSRDFCGSCGRSTMPSASSPRATAGAPGTRCWRQGAGVRWLASLSLTPAASSYSISSACNSPALSSSPTPTPPSPPRMSSRLKRSSGPSRLLSSSASTSSQGWCMGSRSEGGAASPRCERHVRRRCRSRVSSSGTCYTGLRTRARVLWSLSECVRVRT